MYFNNYLIGTVHQTRTEIYCNANAKNAQLESSSFLAAPKSQRMKKSRPYMSEDDL